MTSITYVHYIESMHKRAFQKNIDEMIRHNGLPRVVFPTTIATGGIKELYIDMQIAQEQDIQTDEAEEEIRGAIAMELDSHKRTRELSISPKNNE